MKRKQSGLRIMSRLIVLVKPLSGFMCLAVLLGVLGFLCAIQITVAGSLTLLTAAKISGGIAIKTGCICIIIFAVLRGFLHYGEQACNHYIAFKLLALIRDKVFKAMRRLSPAKLEGKDKGNLVSVITSDIELLEVFYAHTISPTCIAILTCLIMLIFIGRYSIWLSLVALAAYITVGAVIPLVSSRLNKNAGMTYRDGSGALSGFVLDTIDEQALLGRGDLEPYLTRRPRALLPQLGQTERPDKFAGALLDGCVGLLVDGLPMGYLLPTTFRLLMHTPEDEAHNYLLASALIVLRYFALALSLTFPALYVAVAMYHQEMIPAKLLLSVIQAKQQVPFSVPAIILFMLIAFELLQEAGLRLPNSIGQTVSIIGALLVGQSAVDAKIVSPVAIIVVALAGIAGYTLPNQELSNAVRLLRLALVLAAALAGLFGILAMLGLVIWYLCTIDSDGVAYMAPFVDSERPALWRTLLRRPQPDNKFRPPEYGSENRRRQR